MTYIELAVKHFGFKLEEGTTFEDYEQLSESIISCEYNSQSDGFGDDGLTLNVVWRKGQDTEFYTIIARDYNKADITKRKCLHFEKMRVIPKRNEETGYKSNTYENKFRSFGLYNRWIKVFEDGIGDGEMPQYYAFTSFSGAELINISIAYPKKYCLEELFSSIDLIPFSDDFIGNFKFKTNSNGTIDVLYNEKCVFEQVQKPLKVVYSDFANILILPYESFIRVVYGCCEKYKHGIPYEDILNEKYISYYLDFNMAMYAMFIVTNKCEWATAPWEKNMYLWRMIDQQNSHAHVKAYNILNRKYNSTDELLTIECCATPT